MDTEPTKIPWNAPATTSLTDADSRADQPDVAIQNGPPLSPS